MANGELVVLRTTGFPPLVTNSGLSIGSTVYIHAVWLLIHDELPRYPVRPRRRPHATWKLLMQWTK